MSESNKAIVSKFVHAVSAGDPEGILNNLAADLSWTFFGGHRFAGTMHGKDELMQGLSGVVGQVFWQVRFCP